MTHPEITRYFMTIPEAAWLILEAAAIGHSGDLFVLEMGEPVRIVDLARDLVRLAGRDPDEQLFTVTGLRPGEKLHEELFYSQELVRPTENPKVLRVSSSSPPATLRDDVRRLLGRATGDDDAALRSELLAYASAWEPLLARSSAADDVGQAAVTESETERTDAGRVPDALAPAAI